MPLWVLKVVNVLHGFSLHTMGPVLAPTASKIAITEEHNSSIHYIAGFGSFIK